MSLTVASLCSGYGGAEMALTLAGWQHELAFVADPDPAASKLLAHHHPNVPNLGDITRVAWDQLGLAGQVDILAAGFPCTDISCAGRRAGLGEGTRSGVWSHVAKGIDVLQPRLVLLENVAALLSTPANRSTNGTDSDVEPGTANLGDGPDRSVLRAIGAVLGDLSVIGYDAVWQVVSAASVGAPHLRKRVFILAWPAADPPRFGHRDAGTTGVRGVLAAAVACGAGADGLSLLPTPRTTDSNGAGEHGTGGIDLRTAVSLLPTPRATDGTKGGPNQRGSAGDLMLPSAVMQLLPTPTAKCAEDSQTHRSGKRSGELLLTGVVQAHASGALLITPSASDAGRAGEPEWAERWAEGEVIPETHQRLRTQVLMEGTDRWGDYAPAIARWESVTGRPAPEPTEPGRNGQPRLSPRFVEWMQGLPDGHITAVPGISRNDALRLLGNGIVPLQGAAAVTQLAASVAGLFASEVSA